MNILHIMIMIASARIVQRHEIAKDKKGLAGNI